MTTPDLKAMREEFEEWVRDRTYDLRRQLTSSQGHRNSQHYASAETQAAWEAWQAATLRAQAVPPGWQMVPIEPTVEMRLALARFEDLESPDRAWRAALAAAPTPKEK